MNSSLRILHLEDDPADARLIRDILLTEGLSASLDVVDNRAAFEAALRADKFDLILADYKLPGFDGMEALARAQVCCPQKPFLFVTGSMGEERAVQSLKSGATDYILKDGLARLAAAIRRSMLEAEEHALRRAAEIEAGRQRQQFQRLAENSPDIIARFDRHCRYLYVNPSIKLATGLPPDHYVGKTNAEAGFSRIDCAKWDGALRRAFVGQRTNLELVLTDAEAGSRHLDCLVVPELGTDGEIETVLTIARDVTLRHQAEGQLRRTAEELKRSNRDLEQFAYVASHDLKEPLRAVSGYAALLQRSLGDKLTDQQQRYLQGAVEGVKRMEDLIEDLLAFSRAGKRSTSLAPANLNELLRRAQVQLHAAFERSGAQLTAETLPILVVDASQITQVFQNLMANAIKFCEQNPPRISVAARKEPGRWIISVRDNGIGIAPEHFRRIYQLFERLHTREKYPGSGIGLAICQRIIERHEGAIWVESTPGRGATFSFSLPDPPRVGSQEDGDQAATSALPTAGMKALALGPPDAFSSA